MATKRYLNRKTSPTGLAVWQVPDSEMQIMWSGPGGRLSFGQAYKAGGAMTFIEHPSADGAYDSLKAAEAAVKRFMEASGKTPIPFGWAD